ncbi:hypothetical protein [Leptolyngbya sp. FACHB-17]|uniref:hypothetical protein n=1 Tax=unclassified Leptolyngbya TaxID=2650499 RepID=UPI0016806BC0|nr:hypothetical protein [Leptolyngbya sp. FACHB-17]MBD2079501.1 hypothetical protein [Leptolyngbya sp. FACHB-17]
MQVQRFICGAIGLSVAIASSSHAHFPPLSSFSVVGRPAIASSQPTIVFEQIRLPRSVANTVRRTLQQDSQNRIDNVRTIASPIQNVSEEMRSHIDMVSLSNTLTNAVIQDAQERFNTPELMLEMASDSPTNIGIQLESIESVIWNECRGNSGPSRSMRGLCPDIDVFGWRVVVAGRALSEPLRLVYYIPQGAEVGFWTPQPDGLQSLSEAVQRRILTQVAEDAGISTSSLHLFWAEARFFDRSLNTREGALSCSMDIRPGWAVQIMVDQAISGTSTQQPLWVYHTNITGTDVRRVSQGQWMPPP